MRCMRTPLAKTRSSRFPTSGGTSERIVSTRVVVRIVFSGLRRSWPRTPRKVSLNASFRLRSSMLVFEPNQRTMRPSASRNGPDAREEPAERAVRASERELHLERLARLDRVLPSLRDDIDHRRVVDRFPSPPLHLRGRRPRVFVPAAVVVIDVSVGAGGPRELG